VSLFIAGKLDQMVFKDSFQLKRFCDSIMFGGIKEFILSISHSHWPPCPDVFLCLCITAPLNHPWAVVPVLPLTPQRPPVLPDLGMLTKARGTQGWDPSEKALPLTSCCRPYGKVPGSISCTTNAVQPPVCVQRFSSSFWCPQERWPSLDVLRMAAQCLQQPTLTSELALP